MPKTRPLSQQRKRRVRISKAAPFPIPIATVTGETASNSNWIYYIGVLQENSVMVHHSGDMDFLYRMGFFGKGSMSRGQPLWADQSRIATLSQKPVQTTDSDQKKGWQRMFRAKILSRRRYMNHLKWHLMSVGDHATLEKLDQDGQYMMEESRQTSTEHVTMETDQINTAEAETDFTEKADYTEDELLGSTLTEGESNKSAACRDWSDEEEDAEFWGIEESSVSPTKKAADRAAATWDSSHPGDADFWETENTVTTESSLPDSACVDSTEVSYPSDSQNVQKSTLISAEAVGSRLEQSQGHCVRQGDVAGNSSFTQMSTVGENAICSESKQPSEPFGTDNGIVNAPKEDISVEEQAESCSDISNNENKTKRLTTTSSEDCDKSMETENSSTDKEESSVTCHSVENISNHSNCRSSTDGKVINTNSPNHSDSEKSIVAHNAVKYSEFCEDDEAVSRSDGRTLLVIPDSDDEDDQPDGSVCKLKTKWKPVIKNDPFLVKERLHLSFEEAFFLSYGLGCLSVIDSQKTPMDLTRMWQEFCQRQPDFLPNYIAYHYFRSKNWVPKTGLKFGCTFLLYRDGPPFFHGSYSVTVKFIDTEGKPVEGFGEQRQFSWQSLAGLKRITEHVGKELMFCYVIKPTDLTLEEMQSPKCIPRFRVKEMLVSRWVSSQEREGKALEDMP